MLLNSWHSQNDCFSVLYGSMSCGWTSSPATATMVVSKKVCTSKPVSCCVQVCASTWVAATRQISWLYLTQHIFMELHLCVHWHCLETVANMLSMVRKHRKKTISRSVCGKKYAIQVKLWREKKHEEGNILSGALQVTQKRPSFDEVICSRCASWELKSHYLRNEDCYWWNGRKTQKKCSWWNEIVVGI